MNFSNDLTQTLTQNTAILIDEHFIYSDLKNAADSLFDFFEEISQLDVNALKHNDAIYLSSGKAIGPYWAGRCVTEFMRTRQFLRGIYNGIQDLQKRFPNEIIHILYAGTGPFGTLIMPLTTLFKPSEIQITCLEINPESITCLHRVIAALHVEDYIRDIVHCDATKYKNTTDQAIHMVITETMLNGLQNEPQVAITRNLVPQMLPNGILIPQNISVTLNLVDKKAETDRLFAGNTNHVPFFKEIISLIELNKETCTNPDLYRHIEVNLTAPAEPRFNRVSLFTTIQVYEEHIIGHNACSLTLPIDLKALTQTTLLENKLIFNYEFSDCPKFEYKLIS